MRETIFDFLRSMFKKRGKLFHGQFDLSSQDIGSLIDDEELKRLLSIVRRSILKFLALLLRGENNLNTVRKDIEKAILDEIFRWEFLERADYESLLRSDQN